jgi:DNA repair exonuclease SbcCD ATPase subunit
LRCARNALLSQAQRDATERAELLRELDQITAEKNSLTTLLQELKRELEKSDEEVENLQRRLSECQHLLLDQRARADSQEISLGALRLRLKFFSDKDLAPPTRTSVESLLISSDHRGGLAMEDLESAWQAFAPRHSIEDDSDLDFASVL